MFKDLLQTRPIIWNYVVAIIDHGEFMLGSLSHLLNARASGYQELPDFPDVPPDPSVRNVEVGF